MVRPPAGAAVICTDNRRLGFPAVGVWEGGQRVISASAHQPESEPVEQLEPMNQIKSNQIKSYLQIYCTVRYISFFFPSSPLHS
jgi:hypothetical protein